MAASDVTGDATFNAPAAADSKISYDLVPYQKSEVAANMEKAMGLLGMRGASLK